MYTLVDCCGGPAIAADMIDAGGWDDWPPFSNNLVRSWPPTWWAANCFHLGTIGSQAWLSEQRPHGGDVEAPTAALDLECVVGRGEQVAG